MATGNFYNKNANNIYAIFQENEYDDFIYQDTRDNIASDLEVYTKNSKAYLGYSNNNYIDDYLIEVVSITKKVAGIPLSVDIDVLMRSGYYEGANLDYEISYRADSVEFDDLSDAFQAYFDVATYDFDMNKGLATIQAKNAAKRLEAMSEELIENVERILKVNCTHVLKVFARFSNGETWYSKVKTA
jgi:hypothetical protein